MAPKKVAILGGGVSALTAAYWMTSYPGWQEDWDLTVYQMGWRLGGKGASGRNRDRCERIEEHGLHIFLGFYENAFRTMRGLYEALDRSPGEPLARWNDAWKPRSFVVFMDQIAGRWDPWPFSFPENESTPGDGRGSWPTAWDYVKMMIGWVTEWVERAGFGPLRPRDGEKAGDEAWARLRERLRRDLPDLAAHAEQGAAAGEAAHPPLLDHLAALVAEVADDAGAALRAGAGEASAAARIADEELAHLLGHLAHELSATLPEDAAEHRLADHRTLRWLLERLRAAVWRRVEPVLDSHPRLRRAFILIDLWAACAIGMLVDRIVEPPIDWFRIDDLDFRAWIMKHGAQKITAWSGPINSAYALAFGEETEIGAGTGLHGILRLVGGYKGAIFWEMQAGMGDTVFTPFYDVLSRRGVKFEFFHRVDRLEVQGRQVTKIHLGRPVTVKQPPYDPLVEVRGLRCWPSEPHYDQLVEGAALAASGADLEDWWTDWVDRCAPRVLEHGREVDGFDVCILGTAIGTYREIAAEVLQASPAMATMVDQIETTQTQAMQLWFDPDLAGLGWPMGERPIVGSYALWFDTWADLTHLLAREDWPAAAAPKNLAYLVSRLVDDEPMPPRTDHGYTARQAARVRAHALAWLAEHAGGLWPAAVDPSRRFAWPLLHDPAAGVGEVRLDAQYLRGTLNPSERYVLSVPGSTAFRLRAEETGLDNLVMCGDHTFTGINAGCVEAATMSGMNAARHLCGHPAEIAGDALPRRKGP
jgi:uncharacterized protein with NAD-binding domain and iron-sulfur cluster